MLLKDNFKETHIRAIQKTSRRDPGLLERTIYAFGLLEALVRSGLPFIFKGGTCLMLLMDTPRRLSTDIDIIVKPGTDIYTYLEEASKIFPFQKVEEQKREGKNQIVKQHFKFTYDSPIQRKPFYILLDVLYEENHYAQTVEKEIRTDFLLSEPEYLKVEIPSADCILADKLTAFAPHTTGIKLNDKKDMEVMKQLYDVITLIDAMTDCEHILPTYQLIAQAEIAYRGLNAVYQDCLWDTYESAFCVASRGKINQEEYTLYVDGIRELRGHIYSETYTPEVAAVRAIKVMYLVMCLLSGSEYKKVTDPMSFAGKKVSNKNLSVLNYYRKINLEAYAYLIQLDEILIEKKG